MNVRNLIRLLKQFDGDLRVVSSIDEEGNMFLDTSGRFGRGKMANNENNQIYDCLVIYPTGDTYDVLEEGGE